MPKKNKLSLGRFRESARRFTAEFTDGSSQDEVFSPDVNTNNNAKGDGKASKRGSAKNSDVDEKSEQNPNATPKAAKTDKGDKPAKTGTETSETSDVQSPNRRTLRSRTQKTDKSVTIDPKIADEQAAFATKTLSEMVKEATGCIQLAQAFKELGIRKPVPAPDCVSLSGSEAFDVETFRQTVEKPYKYEFMKSQPKEIGKPIMWADISDLYDFAMTRPPFECVHHHEHYAYLKALIVNRISTEFTYSVSLETTRVLVPAQTMCHLILTDQYRYAFAGGRKEGMAKVKILVPDSWVAIRRAEIELQYIDLNSIFLKVFEYYPYVPYQHELPIMHPNEEMNWNFAESKFDPEPPTQANWRTFCYGVSNIRHHGKTYAANCRHETTQWNEHPWCEMCLVNYGIKVCGKIEGEMCYMCPRMTDQQVRDFLAKIKSLRKTKAKSKDMLTKKSHKCPAYIRHQIHADKSETLANRATDANPAWAMGRYGFCRPMHALPFYYTDLEFTYDENACTNLDETIKSHTECFDVLYNVLQDTDKPGIWPDLSTIGQRATAVKTPKPPPEKLVVVMKKAPVQKPPKAKKTPIVSSKNQQVGYVPPTPPRRPRRKATKPVKTPVKDPITVSFSSEEDQDDVTAPGVQQALIDQYMPSFMAGQLKDTSRGKDMLMSSSGLEVIPRPTKPKYGKPWDSAIYSVTTPASSPEHTFPGFEDALRAAAAIAPKVAKRIKAETPKLEADYMSRPLVLRHRVTYEPTDRFMRKIDDSLRAYEQSADFPDLREEMPINLYDFAKSGMPSKVHMTVCDTHGNYPDDSDQVMVLQREIATQDAQSRALFKLHEMDDILLESLCNRFEALNVARSPEQKQAQPIMNELLICDALRHNLITRENLLASQQAMITAARRRDMTKRYHMDTESEAAIVSKSFAFTDTVQKRADVERLLEEIDSQKTPVKSAAESKKKALKRKNLEEIFNDPSKKRGDSLTAEPEGEIVDLDSDQAARDAEAEAQADAFLRQFADDEDEDDTLDKPKDDSSATAQKSPLGDDQE